MDYNPDQPLAPEEWLAVDEDERLDAVRRWVSVGIELPPENCTGTAVPIVIVENQIAENHPPVVAKTLERLLADGIDRTTAIEVLSDILQDNLRDAASVDSEFDRNTYTRELRQLKSEDILMDDPETEALRESAAGVPEFSADHRRRLSEFGERHAVEKAMSWPETAGFLFVVTACPEFIMPSEWTEIVQGEAVFKDIDEARAVTEARMALMNWISGCIQEGHPAIPHDCRPDSDPMQNLEADNDFSRWCRGFNAAYLWLEEVWNEEIGEDSEDDRALRTVLVVLSFFVGRKIAEKVVEENARHAGSEAKNLEETARHFHRLIEQAIQGFAIIGQKYQRVPSPPPRREPVRTHKVGRNQPCPCGSGKKYKKCCGAPRSVH